MKLCLAELGVVVEVAAELPIKGREVGDALKEGEREGEVGWADGWWERMSKGTSQRRDPMCTARCSTTHNSL